MKYILTISLSMLSIFYTHGQISTPKKATPPKVVGKIAPLGSFVAELSYTKGEEDTTYVLSFNNMKYKHIDAIESVAFSGKGNTVDELYKSFKSVFLSENKKNKDYLIHFTLGTTDVSISQTKSMGVTSAMFLVKEAFFTLTEKQVDKLFGK